MIILFYWHNYRDFLNEPMVSLKARVQSFLSHILSRKVSYLMPVAFNQKKRKKILGLIGYNSYKLEIDQHPFHIF